MSSSQLKAIQMFIKFAARELKLPNLPNIKFAGSEENTKNAFGHSIGNNITVRITERHPVDIMRTIAHELVHFKQNHTGSNKTSVREDQANMLAGRLMKKFDITYPHIFKEKAIREETVSAVPANLMGASSSTQGTGGIDIYDPLMKISKRKKKRKKLREFKEPPTKNEIAAKLLTDRVKNMSKGQKGKGVNTQPNPIAQTLGNGNTSARNTMNIDDTYTVDNATKRMVSTEGGNNRKRTLSSLIARQ